MTEGLDGVRWGWLHRAINKGMVTCAQMPLKSVALKTSMSPGSMRM